MAAVGGDLLLAATWRVYNELVATKPDLIKVLAESNWPFDTFGFNPAFYKRALLHYHDGRPILNFSRRLLEGSDRTPRTPGIPALTEQQYRALDAIHAIAEQHHANVQVQSGDMIFINNLAIMHARSGFQDSHNAKRHGMRMWLQDPERGWSLPPGLQLDWARVFEPLPDFHASWDLDPPEYKREFDLDQSSSCG